MLVKWLVLKQNTRPPPYIFSTLPSLSPISITCQVSQIHKMNPDEKKKLAKLVAELLAGNGRSSTDTNNGKTKAAAEAASSSYCLPPPPSISSADEFPSLSSKAPASTFSIPETSAWKNRFLPAGNSLPSTPKVPDAATSPAVQHTDTNKGKTVAAEGSASSSSYCSSPPPPSFSSTKDCPLSSKALASTLSTPHTSVLAKVPDGASSSAAGTDGGTIQFGTIQFGTIQFPQIDTTTPCKASDSTISVPHPLVSSVCSKTLIPAQKPLPSTPKVPDATSSSAAEQHTAQLPVADGGTIQSKTGDASLHPASGTPLLSTNPAVSLDDVHPSVRQCIGDGSMMQNQRTDIYDIVAPSSPDSCPDDSTSSQQLYLGFHCMAMELIKQRGSGLSLDPELQKAILKEFTAVVPMMLSLVKQALERGSNSDLREAIMDALSNSDLQEAIMDELLSLFKEALERVKH